ncbi:sigma-70 family RNA polymerase sigma factor [Fluviicola sp. SGL-29]|nr:sigma-70 family RNA polymerase sigma factor [Fluviicola sp. SGL-29]
MHHLSNQSDEALMILIKDHQSHPALTELHRRYSRKLLGYFIKMLNRDEHLAQDFVQELFLKIWEKNQLFQEDKKLYTWLFTIASNMCKTHYRNCYRMVPEDMERPVFDRKVFQENSTDKTQFQEALKLGIDSLEVSHKTVFILRYLEQFSLQEIAEITETPVGTVKSRLFYATRKMTENLKAFDPKYEENLFKIS